MGWKRAEVGSKKKGCWKGVYIRGNKLWRRFGQGGSDKQIAAEELDGRTGLCSGMKVVERGENAWGAGPAKVTVIRITPNGRRPRANTPLHRDVLLLSHRLRYHPTYQLMLSLHALLARRNRRKYSNRLACCGLPTHGCPGLRSCITS